MANAVVVDSDPRLAASPVLRALERYTAERPPRRGLRRVDDRVRDRRCLRHCAVAVACTDAARRSAVLGQPLPLAV